MSGRVFRILALALFVKLIAPDHAAAQTTSASQMMSFCEPVANARVGQDHRIQMEYTFDGGVCFGAFLAFHSLSFLYDNNERLAQHESLLGVCAPVAVTVVQMVRIFVSYARQHPEEQHQAFDVVAISAFRTAFPCTTFSPRRP